MNLGRDGSVVRIHPHDRNFFDSESQSGGAKNEVQLQVETHKNPAHRLHTGILKEAAAHRPKCIRRVGIPVAARQSQQWNHYPVNSQAPIPRRILVKSALHEPGALH